MLKAQVKLAQKTDTTSLDHMKLCVGHTDIVKSVAFSPDNKVLASGSEDKTIILWDVETGKQVNSLSKHAGSVNQVTFGRDGSLLVSASADASVMITERVSFMK